MLNLNKCTKTKPKPALIFKNGLYLCAYHCAQLPYKIQHGTVLIIFPLILQTIIIAEMMSTGGRLDVVTEMLLICDARSQQRP